MTNCEACGAENSGPGRYCRQCGAPAYSSVTDLADTCEFNPAPHVSVVNPPTGKADTGPSNTYPLAQGGSSSFDTGSLIRKLNRLVHGKIGWLEIFLFLSLLIPTGMVIGRDFVRSRRAERYERVREAEILRQQKQAKQAEAARRNASEAVQNALGLKPVAVAANEYPDIQGVFVASLTSDYGPAATAGVRAGDILFDFGGQPLHDMTELKQALEGLRPGTDVAIKLFRDGETVSSTIRVGDRSTPPLQTKNDPRFEGFLGLGDVTRRCCVSGSRKWALEVHRVIDNSPADLAGLQPGDLVTEFDGQSVVTPDELSRRIKTSKPRTKVSVKFYRGSVQQTVDLTIGHGW